MPTVQIDASRIIAAAPQDIYQVIADYETGHQAILPKPYFHQMDVEEGGFGAGTVINVVMNVMGRQYNLRMRVEEPEPGRVIVEKGINSSEVTTFTIEPVANGTKVTIATDFPKQPGMPLWLQRIVQPPMVRWLYNKELKLLEDYVN